MDSIEVAVRFTEAIMAKSNSTRKGEDLAQTYVDTFAEVLRRVKVLLEPLPASPPPAPLPRATSEVFPLSHDRR